MTVLFIVGLLLLDAVLTEVARRRADRPVPDVALYYGAFVSGSGLFVMWNLIEPGPAAFFGALGWVFVTSVPAAWIAATRKPPKRDTKRGRRAGAEDEDPLHVKPAEEEARALAGAGMAPESVLATARTDLSMEGEFESGLVAASATHLAYVGGREEVWCEPLERLAEASDESLVGGGRLVVKDRNGAVRIVARHTNACARPVGTVAKRVNDFLEGRKRLQEYEEKKAKGELDKEKDRRPDDPKVDFSGEDLKRKVCPSCGYRLEEDTEVCPRCVKRARVIVRLLKYARPYWTWLAVMLALMLVGTALNLVPPWLSKMLFDDVLVAAFAKGGDRSRELLHIVLSLGGVFALMAVNGAVGGRIATYFGSVVVRDLRAKVFRHLQLLSLGYFDKHRVGALMARLSHDVEMVQILMVDGIQFTVINGLLVVGISVALIVMNWKLGLLALLPAPMLLAFSVWFWAKVHGLFHRAWERFSRLTAFVNDSLGGVRVVKAFGQEPQEMKRFDAKNLDVYNSMVGAEVMWATFRPGIGLLMQSGTLLVWYFGGKQVLNQEMTPGTIVAYLGYLMLFYGPLMMLTQLNHFLTRCLAAAERIFEIMDAKPDVKDADDARELPRVEGRVELKNVTFGYDRLKPVLKHVDLVANPGEMIGLVGHSGAGKSTTINVICRLYDVQEGEVLIDGTNVKAIRQESLRRQVGIVLQETYLFSGTIAENIAYSHPSATREDIMRAAVAAKAHDFIMAKPDGYDTQVGERGSTLSGGEKQRVAIARAILHNPRILILDEATSSVDTQTEQQIQQALENLMKDRTTFAIAHRLSTLRRANRLVVLDQGKIIETGSHDELIEKKGTYAKLVESQAEVAKVMTLVE